METALVASQAEVGAGAAAGTEIQLGTFAAQAELALLAASTTSALPRRLDLPTAGVMTAPVLRVPLPVPCPPFAKLVRNGSKVRSKCSTRGITWADLFSSLCCRSVTLDSHTAKLTCNSATARSAPM